MGGRGQWKGRLDFGGNPIVVQLLCFSDGSKSRYRNFVVILVEQPRIKVKVLGGSLNSLCAFQFPYLIGAIFEAFLF